MIEVKYRGRLGNNLFQYCFGRILAEELGYALKADPIPGFPNTQTEVKGHDYSSYSTKILSEHHVNLGTILRDNTKRKIVLNGFFQRYEYYKSYKDKIRSDWLKSSVKLKKNLGEDDILIHIRLRDYLTHTPESLLPFSFYEEVLDKAEYSRVLICTDQPKHQFIKKFKKYDFTLKHSSPLEDFNFIKSAKKIIQSQSSYSCWAAFLSQAEDIYTPQPLEGYWSDQRPDVDLIVDDEDRYIYVKCKDVYHKTFRDNLVILKNNIRGKIKATIEGKNP